MNHRDAENSRLGGPFGHAIRRTGAKPHQSGECVRTPQLPGQWYLSKNSSANTAANTLSYIPRSGENMAAANVVAPVLETLVSISENSGSSPVHNLQFNGIAFAYATWLMENWQLPKNNGFVDGQATFSLDKVPGNVTLTNATDIVFQGDIFAHLGSAGIALNAGAQYDSVIGSIFTDMVLSRFHDGEHGK